MPIPIIVVLAVSSLLYVHGHNDYPLTRAHPETGQDPEEFAKYHNTARVSNALQDRAPNGDIQQIQ